MMRCDPEPGSGFFYAGRKGVVPLKTIMIKGRNRQDARKKMLSYYFAHRDQFGCSMKDFLKRCSMDPTGRVILYKECEG